MRTSLPLLAFLFLALLGAPKAEAGGVIATLKSPSLVVRSDARNGTFLGSISVQQAIAVGCDGDFIAVLSSGGRVTRYDAARGSFLGIISADSKASQVQVSGGVIAVQVQGRTIRYDAATGRYLGSS